MLLVMTVTGNAQAVKDSSQVVTGKHYSLHWQATAIPQYHFNFKAPYSGNNSLLPSEPVMPSFTTTAFFAYKPFKHTYIVFNPEAAGGKGLSKTLGVAGFPNGEIYRVGDPKPQPFIARLYVEQRFPIGNKLVQVEDDLNQVAETTHSNYLSLTVGKFAMTDFFDDSQISHDPRSQFMNWSLMGSGAWDYPANTRGYTMGAVAQLYYNDWVLRTALTTVPIEANGQALQFKWNKAMGMVWEVEKTHLLQKDTRHFSSLHAGLFLNKARMGNYALSIQQAGSAAPDITDSRIYGRTKWGWYASLDNHFGNIHHFIRYSWSDGKNETWAFTEIDRSIATGLRFDGELWKRKNDHLGLAIVNNALSSNHKRYLTAGGYGFIIGDGKLNYGTENIIEAYYSLQAWKKFFITPDYQFILHPAYNKDRGPVHVVSLRIHVEF